MTPRTQLRLSWGPLYLRLTAVVLGTLSLFGVTVVLLHLAALGRATAPMRAEVLRIVADARAGRASTGTAAARGPQFPSALFGPDGQQRSGRPVPWWIRRDLLRLTDGEHCSRFLGLCYAVRTVPLADGPGHLILYQVSAASALGPLSLAFVASVLIWLLASSATGLILLSALRRADESRRRLLAGLAHDLGTPLTSIRGFAETLLAAPVPDPSTAEQAAARRGWSIVYREALRMQRLVEDMLALTRLEARRLDLVRRPFDLRALVESAAERAALAFGTPPELRLAADPALITADRDRIDQVLGNLLDNAYRHGRGQQVGVSLEPAGPGFQVAVTDHGPGLSAKARARLFEPFHRGDGEAGGSGLGLAIARHIAERHGGSLAVDDAPGGGCRAVLTLPVGPG